MNGQNGSTGDLASRVASSAPRASTEPSPRPSKAGSMTVCVNATADLVRWYSANPATSPSTSTSKRPASGLSTTLGSLSVTMTTFLSVQQQDSSGGDGRVHLPDEDLRRLGGGDPLAAGGGEANRVAGAQLSGALEGHRAARDEQVQVRGIGQLDGLTGLQPGGVQRGVSVMDADGGGAAVLGHAGGDRHEAAGEQGVVDLELLVAGDDAALVGHGPHLDEVHRIAVLVAALQPPGVVLLAVLDPGAGAHPLGQTRIDDAVVARGVLVHQGALHHPGDDLHVPVRVGLEPEARCHDVVVVDQQQPVVLVVVVVVVAEREGVLAVQPPDPGAEPLGGAADVDARGEGGSAHVGSSGRRGGMRMGRAAAGRSRRAAAPPGDQAFLIAETSNSRTILSLTRTPPVSSAAFQVMP